MTLIENEKLHGQGCGLVDRTLLAPTLITANALLWTLIERVLVNRAHPQQAYRSLLGIRRLGKSYGESRLVAACNRALQINAFSSCPTISLHGVRKIASV